jgi:NTE family protein
VAGRGLDLVICLNPLTSAAEGSSGVGAVLDLIPAITRRASRGRLEREERKLRRFGTEVVIIEPTAEDHAAMGRNWMSAARRQHVIETAERTVAEQLRSAEVRARLAELPKGEAHKISRPPGPPSSWPAIRPAARRAA